MTGLDFLLSFGVSFVISFAINVLLPPDRVIWKKLTHFLRWSFLICFLSTPVIVLIFAEPSTSLLLLQLFGPPVAVVVLLWNLMRWTERKRRTRIYP
jgi:hypothetical protein